MASKTAVECMVGGFHGSKDGESHSAVLQRLVQQANTSIFEAALTRRTGFSRNGHYDCSLRLAV